MRHVPWLRAAVGVSLSAAIAGAQEAPAARPYAFLLTPLDSGGARLASAEAGYTDGGFQPLGGGGVGPALALHAPVGGALSVFVRAGTSFDARTTRSSVEGMLLLTTHPLASRRTYLALGAGALRGYDATSALRLHVGAGASFARSRLDAVVLAERPLARGRDAVDLVTSVGWMRDLGTHAHLGAEAVGQDTEGFWDSEEAEGGARLFVGPSGSVTSGRWRLGLTAGPVIRATWSDRSSGAERPLSTRVSRFGLGLRTAVSRAW